ncbi:MAG TPA: hypothetical protein VHL52_04585 [Acidimicrobiia bacterium]|nr:hypothetical protein [Acidimicrobiia bacterium]
MALNADPKPGRWILPLVVLGMVAFTYFFVRALPSGSEEGSPDTTVGASDTTLGENGTSDTTSDTTVPDAPTLDPATQEYLDAVGSILTRTEELQREMAAVNGGFDADPRTVEFGDAVDRLTALADQADTLVEELDGLSVPEPLTSNHETIRTASTTAAAAAEEALEGLQSDDDGSRRRDAVTAFDTAVSDLQTAVSNARSAAGLSATPTTEAPPDTADTTTDTTAAPTDTTEGGEGDG